MTEDAIQALTSDPEINAMLAEFEGNGLDQHIVAMAEGKMTLKDMKGLSDENMEALYGLAYNSYTTGRFQEAMRIFQFLCLFDYFQKKYWMGLGSARHSLKQYREAVQAFAMASLLDMRDPKPPLQAADCNIALGNYEDAESALRGAVELSGDAPEYAAIKSHAEALLEVVRKQTAN